MKDIFVLDNLKQVKALAAPLRVDIVKLLGKQCLTTTQAAKKLGVKPNKLYYHVTELQKAGLLEVVKTRQRGNMVEKFYQPVARYFRIDPCLFGQGMEGRQAFLQTVVSNCDSTILDVRNAMDQGLLSSEEMSTAFSAHVDLNLSREDSHALAEDLRGLVRKYKKRDRDDPESGSTHVTIVFYPKLGPDSEPTGN
ncbi:helix-turn-helix domain-containing protein [Candidatus Fermentibacteria bacterium]|nr:helix-turn-helix domain-containing protein [Candidatus Fermentibacteria bacterium]